MRKRQRIGIDVRNVKRIKIINLKVIMIMITIVIMMNQLNSKNVE